MTDTIDRIDAEPEPASGAPTGPPTRDEQRQALVRLLMIVVAGLSAALVTGTTKTVLVVVAMLTMIMLHELGHYLTAKWGGMKVTEFFVGFGPRLWSVRKGETEYGVKALPIGGYVKILGMHNLDRIEDPADEPRTYRQQPFPQRLAVAVAGSTMHFLIALVLFLVINIAVGIPQSSLKIGEISKVSGGPSPAQQAGFQVGDRIISVDGRTFTSWKQLPPYIQARPGQQLTFAVERDGRQVTLTATPLDLSEVSVDGTAPVDKPTGFVGIGPSVEFATKGIAGVPLAFKQLVGGNFLDDRDQVAPGLIDNARALAGVFSPHGIASYWNTLTGKEGVATADNPEGGTRFLSPVGFVRIAGEAADTGLFEVLILMIAINLFVGLFNLLPLLPLDGGHVAIAVYELVRSKLQGGKRYFTDVAKLMPITYAVVMLLVFLGISALYLDIVRPLSFQ